MSKPRQTWIIFVFSEESSPQAHLVKAVVGQQARVFDLENTPWPISNYTEHMSTLRQFLTIT